ncbi:MAG: flagellar hook-associated protein 3 FlgL [Eubacteriaceae bacterium]|nr:flagellar hook-associated protein 3 FlgL [Eubacteriaceae bacterium]
MRITYKMMTSRYTDNLNSQQVELDRLNNQIASGRAFARTSEDTSTAIRSYQVRKEMSKVENYQNNIEYAQGFLTNSESAMSGINGSLQDATDKILQGLNDTSSNDSRDILSNEIEKIQEQILETLNTKVNDIFIFGGSNTTEKPFAENAAGEFCYYCSNGTEVVLSNITSDKTNTDPYPGTSPIPDNATPTKYEVYKYLAEDSLYIDIGLGVQFDSPGNVDKDTVFEYSIPGISFLFDATTGSNIYDTLGDIADLMGDETNYTYDGLNDLYGQFQSQMNSTSLAVTEIGADTNYLEFMTERYDTQLLNLQERQTKLEGVDAAEVYITYATQQVAYQAALQMGTEIIQQSVFDYMS